MAASPELPADPGVADFDALQDDPARWIGAVAALGARYSGAPAVPAGGGTVLVALLGRERVLELYPPFLRDHFEFERAMLGHLQGRLTLPTPHLVDSAEHAGWPYLVMTQLPGRPRRRWTFQVGRVELVNQRAQQPRRRCPQLIDEVGARGDARRRRIGVDHAGIQSPRTATLTPP